jgi:hypothetical protein
VCLNSAHAKIAKTPDSISNSSQKSRKPRSDVRRRGVIRTMQDCFKKVKRFVNLDNAGSLPWLVCILIDVSRCEDHSALASR